MGGACVGVGLHGSRRYRIPYRGDRAVGPDAQPPQVQVPHPQPPPVADGRASVPDAVPAANEYRRRARSLPQFGHETIVSTDAVIERRSSNRCSQAMQTYS